MAVQKTIMMEERWLSRNLCDWKGDGFLENYADGREMVVQKNMWMEGRMVVQKIMWMEGDGCVEHYVDGRETVVYVVKCALLVF